MVSSLPDQEQTRNRAITVIKNGGVVVMPTDTIYGIVASALLPKAVEKVFYLRKRDSHKPVIILIADFSDLEQFSITIDGQLRKFLSTVWPGAVSVVLPTEITGFTHLHRGTRTLAFRLPNNDSLRAFLRQSGPLIVPSANLAGEPPATTIEDAKKYFGDAVDLYIDGGKRENNPSTLAKWTPDGIAILRQGAVVIENIPT